MDAFIHQHLHGVSRTYALLIPMLPAPLAESVGLAYLQMRIIDTVEDAPELATPERVAALQTLRRVLSGASASELAQLPALSGNPAENALLADARQVFDRIAALSPQQQAAVHTCGVKMIDGVLHLLERAAQRGVTYPAIQSADELREYCHYVAGVVGEMLCCLMSQHLRQPALMRLRDVAIELGLGLQMVNILKDAMKDAHDGRRYLPQTPSGNVSTGEVYRAVLAEARISLQRGTEFVLGLPAAARELRSFCGLPIAWGAMTLARAERDARQAKIGRGAIRSSIALFARLAGDDAALRTWLTRLLSSPQSAAPKPS